MHGACCRCLIEICTALDEGIPIVGVSVATGKYSYDFEAAAALLETLETSLEDFNPGAPAVLLANDMDLAGAFRGIDRHGT